MYEKILRTIFRFDEYYEEDDLRNIAGISANEPVADTYFHKTDCIWVISEIKRGRGNLMKALRQLEVTAEKLLEKGRRVDIAAIIIRAFDDKEKRFFERGQDFELFKKEKKRIKIKILGRIPVCIYYIR